MHESDVLDTDFETCARVICCTLWHAWLFFFFFLLSRLTIESLHWLSERSGVTINFWSSNESSFRVVDLLETILFVWRADEWHQWNYGNSRRKFAWTAANLIFLSISSRRGGTILRCQKFRISNSSARISRFYWLFYHRAQDLGAQRPASIVEFGIRNFSAGERRKASVELFSLACNIWNFRRFVPLAQREKSFALSPILRQSFLDFPAQIIWKETNYVERNKKYHIGSPMKRNELKTMKIHEVINLIRMEQNKFVNNPQRIQPCQEPHRKCKTLSPLKHKST